MYTDESTMKNTNEPLHTLWILLIETNDDNIRTI